MQGNKYQYLIPVWVDSDGSECSEAVLSYSPLIDERRFYRIRARQYDCNNEYLAGPKGCMQYFTNFTHNNGREFQEAFSFNGPWMDPAERHLANQGLNYFVFLFLCLMQLNYGLLGGLVSKTKIFVFNNESTRAGQM